MERWKESVKRGGGRENKDEKEGKDKKGKERKR